MHYHVKMILTEASIDCGDNKIISIDNHHDIYKVHEVFDLKLLIFSLNSLRKFTHNRKSFN